MKRLKKEMWQYMEKVLKRDHIAYRYEPETGEISANISARRYREALEDAFCEKQRCESITNIPVYSLRTIRNPEKLNRLMRINKNDVYVILKKDADKFCMMYCC